MYNSKSLGEDNVYISSYVDNINTLFSYNLQGAENRDIKGDYRVIAAVEGYSNEKDEKIIWRKEFELISTQAIEFNDKGISISKEVPINFDEYNSFAAKIINELRITLPVKLTVSMVVNLKINGRGEPVEKIFSPSIVIPLNTPYFQITKLNTDEKAEKIDIVNKVPIEHNIKITAVLIVLVVILFSVFIYILFFTETVLKNNIQEKKIKRILKEYGTRLVALSTEEIQSFKNKYSVRSMEDLIKLADELNRPVFYNYSSCKNSIDRFYVIENKQLYEYKLDFNLETAKSNIFIFK
nr:DUF5305 family protein [Clostridium caldaquaticum]